MLPTEQKIQGIYVDIDALMDTRLSSLYVVHPELVALALNAGYTTRFSDDFSNVSKVLTKECFKKIYDTRDNQVLYNSCYSKVLGVIRDAVRKLMHQKIETPYTTDIALYVNLYPYNVDKEIEGLIAKALVDLLAGGCSVSFINYSYKELTPAYCNQLFSLMIKYEYAEWFEHHAQTEAIKRDSMCAISLIVPQLFFARMPNPDELALITTGKFDPFKTMETAASPFISLNYMPAEVFSIDIDNIVKFKAVPV